MLGRLFRVPGTWLAGLCATLFPLLLAYAELLSAPVVAALLGLLVIAVSPLFLFQIFPLASLFYRPLVSAGGFNLTLSDVLLSGILFSLLFLKRRPVDSLTRRVILVLGLSSLALPVFSFIGSLSLWSDLKVNLTAFLIYVKRFAEYAALLLVIFYLPRPKSMAGNVIILTASITVATLTALIPSLNNALISAENVQNFGDRRVGLLLNPNIASDFALLFINLGVSLIVFGRGLIRGWVAAGTAMIVPALLLMALSGSRAIIFALVASLLFWVVKRIQNPRFLLGVVAALAVAGGALVANPDNTLTQRWQEFSTQGFKERNVADRLESQSIGLRIYQENPLFGIGGGTLEKVSPRFGKYIVGTDSQYVDPLIDAGIFGLLALLISLACFAWYGLRRGGVFGNALAVNVLGMAVAGLSGYTFFSPFIASYIWFLLLLTHLEFLYRSPDQAAEGELAHVR
ncbi:O-antigen ligase family protein [Deinococcus lacus]|uniref:O-antigen ligase family protein n=1 Tax=Deinococcus lacus TaxID=392561 RepID=A0ABW1YEL2_9DEIO